MGQQAYVIKRMPPPVTGAVPPSRSSGAGPDLVKRSGGRSTAGTGTVEKTEGSDARGDEPRPDVTRPANGLGSGSARVPSRGPQGNRKRKRPGGRH
jgi:hypothetical protein